MLPSVRNALVLVGAGLSDEEKTRIERLMGAVEEALQSQEPQRLKKATAALDEGTQRLATLLIERAMDEAIARKEIT
jgi:hypothetical protein